MKKLLAVLLMASAVNTVSAQQNLVPNGDFEYYTSCPTNLSQTNVCTGWSQFTTGTSDYFNSCYTSGTSGVGVPNNFRGYQLAASGNGYMGGYSNAGTNPYKEYVTRAITPMQVGFTYEVSLSVNLANVTPCGTNDIGVYFFDAAPSSYSTTTTPGVTPQVEWTNIVVSDTQNWVRLTKNFTADSTYDNIAIGGFRQGSNLTTSCSTSNATIYYYFDSVVVKIAKRFGVNFTDSTLCAGDTIRVPYYANTSPLFFQTNNVFTLQLSDASGSFANPVNIGTKSSYYSDTITGIIPTNTTTGSGYRIRMISSNGQDTTYDNGVNIGIGTAVPAKPVANNNSPVCNNDTLRLTASTTTSGVSYRWTGPNNFTSAAQNPSIPNPVPANGGNYFVTAYIYGCEAKDTTTAVVYAGSGPTGTTATTNSPVCADDTLKLFGTANGSSNTYSWSGPGSYSSNAQNPVITGATTTMSGDYVLYANNGNCVSRDTVTVLVKPRPANFTTSVNSPLCTGATILFSASSTSTGVTYAWSGPNGFNSTNPGPFISGAVPAHNGDYYVTATLNGCALKDTLTVQVKPLPNKPVAGSNTPICSGETLNLTSSSSSSNVSYSWTGPNSYTSAQQNPSLSNTTTAMSGNYIVTATMNGCISKDTATVLVKPLPTAATSSNSGPECAGDTLYINISTSSTGATYTWTGPNSFSANTQNTYVANSTASATGWYVATVDLNGCSFKDSTLATVYPIPAAPTASYSSPLCSGETLQLQAGNISGATYTWTGKNNYSATTQNPTRANMQFGDTGTYKVTATVNGCTSAEGSTVVTINPLPFVVIFPTPGDTICVGDKASFTALPNNYAGTPTYKWFVNGFPVGTNTPAYSSTTLNHGDVVRCDMTEYTKCSSAYTDQGNDVDMKVLPWLAPSVTITADPNRTLQIDEYVTFTAVVTNGGPAPKFQWKRNGQNVQGATSYKWSANTISDNDVITVEVTSNYRCPQPTTAISNGITVKVLTGIGDMDNKKALLKVYPNPARDYVIFEYSEPTTAGAITVELNNIVGQKAGSVRLDNNGKAVWDTHALPAGVYIYRLQQGGEVIAAGRVTLTR
ncbi:MAG: T9SS type A sorting domain-containing protein [Chitinophagaceae bacterium]|nr:T9SS type A sorting domain-containing protein [Chitinophagaceae bacterium]